MTEGEVHISPRIWFAQQIICWFFGQLPTSHVLLNESTNLPHPYYPFYIFPFEKPENVQITLIWNNAYNYQVDLLGVKLKVNFTERTKRK